MSDEATHIGKIKLLAIAWIEKLQLITTVAINPIPTAVEILT